MTTKAVRTGQSYLHFMTHNRLDRERNVRHCSSPTEGNREEEERGRMIGQTLSAENNTFSSEEIWKRIFSLRTEVSVKRCAKTPGGLSPAKRIFSSGQTLARDGRQVSQALGKSRTESLDRR